MATIESITQIPGIFAGHCTESGEAGTGCTVIVCPTGATGGVDVRGGAPCTRETDLLRPEDTVQFLHAVVLSGGSTFGLSASCGVAEELERRGIGVDTGFATVPIVTGACLYDLGVGDASNRPTSVDGIEATMNALDEPGVPLERGNVGAGAGCCVGKAAGQARAMKCGLGEDVEEAEGLVCGAVAAVNALGNICDPDTGEILAGMLAEDGRSIASVEDALIASAKLPFDSINRRSNTTLSCVVTNAKLTKAEATKVSQMAADAYAHAIRPTHSTNDGDAVFVMATGEVEAPLDAVGVLATRALERAIADAARSATGAYGLKAACDL